MKVGVLACSYQGWRLVVFLAAHSPHRSLHGYTEKEVGNLERPVLLPMLFACRLMHRSTTGLLSWKRN